MGRGSARLLALACALGLGPAVMASAENLNPSFEIADLSDGTTSAAAQNGEPGSEYVSLALSTSVIDAITGVVDGTNADRKIAELIGEFDLVEGPEPNTFLLLGFGLAGLAWGSRSYPPPQRPPHG